MYFANANTLMNYDNDKTPLYEVPHGREAEGGLSTVAEQRIAGFVVRGTP